MDATEHTANVLDALAHPDPDPDLLPVLSDPDGLALQEQTAGHLVRAILHQGDTVENLKKAMGRDMQAWAEVIARAEAKEKNWRTIVRDWMLRNNVTQLKSPWFTCSIARGREKLTWTEEDRLIGILDAMGATEAIKVTRSVIKKALEPIYNAVPGKFEGVVVAEQGEPTLRILKKE